MEPTGVPIDAGFYKKLLDDMGDGVYFVDRDRRILYWNQGAHRLTGYGAGEVVGRCCHDDFLSHIDSKGKKLCQDGCPLTASIADGSYHEARVFLRHKQGHRVPVLVRVQPLYGTDGQVVGAVEVFSDNSAENESQRRIQSLRRLAFLDHLTELPNRRFLEMTLKTTLSEFEVHGDPFGVLMADIDCFKGINDTHGHCCGDAALRKIGTSLVSALRPADVIGRWGGDEYVAIVRNVDLEALRAIAERCAALARRTAVQGAENAELNLSVSVGAALIRPGESIESLLGRADQLLYASKESGRNRVTVG